MSKKYTVALRTQDGFHEQVVEAATLHIGEWGLVLRDNQDNLVAQFPQYAWVKEETSEA
jgi:hypothetical protein